jgi:hypothetical protein
MFNISGFRRQPGAGFFIGRISTEDFRYLPPLPMFSLPLALFDSMILQIPLSSPFCQETPVLRPALAIASLLILLRRSVGVKQFPTRSAPLSFPLSYCGGHPRSLHPHRSRMNPWPRKMK